MMHRASVHDGKAWRQGLAFWFLLLSIFTHAVVPTGSPLQRISGSAFSATTAEVAIAPKRKTIGTEQAEVGGRVEGSSHGAGTGEPPSLHLAHESLSPRMAAQGTPPLIGAVSARIPHGGAAPFSARAPPSI